MEELKESIKEMKNSNLVQMYESEYSNEYIFKESKEKLRYKAFEYASKLENKTVDEFMNAVNKIYNELIKQ